MYQVSRFDVPLVKAFLFHRVKRVSATPDGMRRVHATGAGKIFPLMISVFEPSPVCFGLSVDARCVENCTTNQTLAHTGKLCQRWKSREKFTRTLCVATDPDNCFVGACVSLNETRVQEKASALGLKWSKL